MHPFLYNFSPPPYLIHDLSSLFCLKYTLYSVHPSIYLQFLFAYNGPTNQNNQLWLGGSKLHSKLWFIICIISCFVVERKYEMNEWTILILEATFFLDWVDSNLIIFIYLQLNVIELWYLKLWKSAKKVLPNRLQNNGLDPFVAMSIKWKLKDNIQDRRLNLT